VQEADIPRFVQLTQMDWLGTVQQEGTTGAFHDLSPNQDGELPCPACGTAAPLVEGACSDCGLVLE
jgi:hypothetical protein